MDIAISLYVHICPIYPIYPIHDCHVQSSLIYRYLPASKGKKRQSASTLLLVLSTIGAPVPHIFHFFLGQTLIPAPSLRCPALRIPPGPPIFASWICASTRFRKAGSLRIGTAIPASPWQPEGDSFAPFWLRDLHDKQGLFVCQLSNRHEG